MCAVDGWTWKQHCWLCRRMREATWKTLASVLVAAFTRTTPTGNLRLRVSSLELYTVARARDRALFQSGRKDVKGNNSSFTEAVLSQRMVQFGGCSLLSPLFPTASSPSRMTAGFRSPIKSSIFWQRDHSPNGSAGAASTPSCCTLGPHQAVHFTHCDCNC